MSASITRLPASPRDPETARQAALDGYAVVDTAAEPAFDDIVRLAVMLCDTPIAAVTFVDRDRVWFKARIGLDQAELPRAMTLTDHLVVRPGLLVVSDLLADERGSALPSSCDGQPMRFFAAAPLLSPDGQVLGSVAVGDIRPRTLSPRQREGLEVLARQTTHLLELRRHAIAQRQLIVEHDRVARHAERAHAELQGRHAQLLDASRRDGLTGLLNRAALAQLKADPEQRRRLDEGGYCLLLLDVDHFKQVNDRHGHLLGDRALRVVADAITASVRESDVSVRYGGEEFLVILPRTGLPQAAEVAHRIRSRVGDALLPFALTVSVGIAAGDPAQDQPEQVFDRADQALYRAKAGGRDRVIVDDTPRL